nr:hypothetical protein [Escherichia coli]
MVDMTLMTSVSMPPNDAGDGSADALYEEILPSWMFNKQR